MRKNLNSSLDYAIITTAIAQGEECPYKERCVDYKNWQGDVEGILPFFLCNDYFSKCKKAQKFESEEKLKKGKKASYGDTIHHFVMGQTTSQQFKP